MVEFLAVSSVTGVFAGKHLGAFTRIVVIACGVVFKECFTAVEMLVNQVTAKFTHLRPQVIEPFAAGVGA